ncbi:Uncharacterized protein TCM_034938 [Theobroma cacao]|uniref:Uncharacterized protein n=1 Tax=Theobroma cacao TaxID=3641 RepID=A0A061FGK1_THECC|nr:Uncharacterized protein TCM_034938 [Theobroma cacao]
MKNFYSPFTRMQVFPHARSGFILARWNTNYLPLLNVSNPHRKIGRPNPVNPMYNVASANRIDTTPCGKESDLYNSAVYFPPRGVLDKARAELINGAKD